MIEIAKILKPQGIKGEIKALPLTNVLAVFNNLKSCFVGKQSVKIEHIVLRQGYLYIKFEGVNTRNDAELYRNKDISVDKQLLEKLKSDEEFLIDDLVGMVIYDDHGSMVGQIVDVVNYGACDIFVLEKDGREYEVPYVEDVFYVDGDSLKARKDKLDEVMIWKLIY